MKNSVWCLRGPRVFGGSTNYWIFH